MSIRPARSGKRKTASETFKASASTLYRVARSMAFSPSRDNGLEDTTTVEILPSPNMAFPCDVMLSTNDQTLSLRTV
ncbi:hypothetical protein AEGHOMDF_3070 [Methylobacterium soli]|nr:hypothetical protein AEGHOMDF_3070 [Methylobacterium soli]